VLPWLAWAWGADEWDGTWPIDQQRAVVASAIDVRRRHGTIGAVREAIAALGIECQVQEWFAQIPAGTPYTFSLLLEAGQAGYSLATLERLRRIVDNTRNLRSHLDLIAPVATSRATLHVSAAAAVGSDMAVQFAGYNLISDGAHISDGAYISNGLILS
jgi:phage tail P2-like protein